MNVKVIKKKWDRWASLIASSLQSSSLSRYCRCLCVVLNKSIPCVVVHECTCEAVNYQFPAAPEATITRRNSGLTFVCLLQGLVHNSEAQTRSISSTVLFSVSQEQALSLAWLLFYVSVDHHDINPWVGIRSSCCIWNHFCEPWIFAYFSH